MEGKNVKFNQGALQKMWKLHFSDYCEKGLRSSNSPTKSKFLWKKNKYWWPLYTFQSFPNKTIINSPHLLKELGHNPLSWNTVKLLKSHSECPDCMKLTMGGAAGKLTSSSRPGHDSPGAGRLLIKFKKSRQEEKPQQHSFPTHSKESPWRCIQLLLLIPHGGTHTSNLDRNVIMFWSISIEPQIYLVREASLFIIASRVAAFCTASVAQSL